jgi:hypothetical protein
MLYFLPAYGTDQNAWQTIQADVVALARRVQELEGLLAAQQMASTPRLPQAHASANPQDSRGAIKPPSPLLDPIPSVSPVICPLPALPLLPAAGREQEQRKSTATDMRVSVAISRGQSSSSASELLCATEPAGTSVLYHRQNHRFPCNRSVAAFIICVGSAGPAQSACSKNDNNGLAQAARHVLEFNRHYRLPGRGCDNETRVSLDQWHGNSTAPPATYPAALAGEIIES